MVLWTTLHVLPSWNVFLSTECQCKVLNEEALLTKTWLLAFIFTSEYLHFSSVYRVVIEGLLQVPSFKKSEEWNKGLETAWRGGERKIKLDRDKDKEEVNRDDGVRRRTTARERTLSVGELYLMPSAPKENISAWGCQVEMDDRPPWSTWHPQCVGVREGFKEEGGKKKKGMNSCSIHHSHKSNGTQWDHC